MSPILGIFTSSSASQYKVGDTGPGGGRIFYVAPTTFTGGPSSTQCKYLEAAPTSGDTAWTDASYVWSGNTNTSTGATGDAIGNGYGNTILMVNQSSTANRAGTVCRAYRGPNNLSDWYLPVLSELNELYAQRGTVGGFIGGGYWTSREFSSGIAWYRDFSTGNQTTSNKTVSFNVRPIRAF